MTIFNTRNYLNIIYTITLRSLNYCNTERQYPKNLEKRTFFCLTFALNDKNTENNNKLTMLILKSLKLSMLIFTCSKLTIKVVE